MLDSAFRNRTERAGILLALFAMLLFSMVDGIWKHCLGATTLPVVFCLTFAVSLTCLLAYAGVTKSPIRPRRTRNAFIYVFFYVCEQVTFAYALGHMPIAELFVILLTTPLFVLFGAHFLLSERLSQWQTLSIFSGFAGALIVIIARVGSTTSFSASSMSHGLPLLFAVSNVVINGSKILFLRRYCTDENVFGLNLSAGFVFAIGAAAIAGQNLLRVPFAVMVWLLLAGFISACGGMAYIRASQIARAPLVAATQYSQIVWAILMGTFIFLEPLSLAAIGGACLIVISGMFLYVRRQT